MDDRIEVTLRSPTKVDLRVLMAGVQLVSAAELEHLKEAGVVVTVGPVANEALVAVPPVAPTFDQGAFDAAVAAQAQLLAGQAFDGELAKLEAEVKELVAMAEKEKADLLSRLDETGKLLTAERQNSANLAEKLTAVTAELDALKAAQPSSQNTTVAKTTAKKGAATS